MANNFNVDVIHNDQIRLHVRIRGDFDGDSAYQLLNIIKESNGIRKITVDTDGLNDIHSFGSDLFLSYMKPLQNQGIDFVFLGKAKSIFRVERYFV